MENWADFEIIWNGGRALLQGQDPYSVADFFYPLPFVYVIAIGALLPLIVALVLWLMVNFAGLVYFFRKRFLSYFPVIIWHLRNPERPPLTELPGLNSQPHTRTQSQS